MPISGAMYIYYFWLLHRPPCKLKFAICNSKHGHILHKMFIEHWEVFQFSPDFEGGCSTFLDYAVLFSIDLFNDEVHSTPTT